MGSMSDREKAMALFGPYPVKGDLAEAVRATAPDSEEYRRLWVVWEEIDRERHAGGQFCDDRLCDKCGRRGMGDDW
jgi:hypothetical protein